MARPPSRRPIAVPESPLIASVSAAEVAAQPAEAPGVRLWWFAGAVLAVLAGGVYLWRRCRLSRRSVSSEGVTPP
jgi:hypothetical protein